MIDEHLFVSKKFDENTKKLCKKFDDFGIKIGDLGQGHLHPEVT